MINLDKPELIRYYPSDINISYDDITNIWQHFLEKEYTEPDNAFNFEDDKIKSCLKISLLENTLSVILERLFFFHLTCYNDDMMIIYIKNEKKMLLMYKSYVPLIETKDILLPFWSFYIDSDELIDNLNLTFEKNENICIINYNIKYSL